MQSYNLREARVEAVRFDGEITEEMRYHVYWNSLVQQHFLFTAKQTHILVKKGQYLVKSPGSVFFAEVLEADKFHSMYRPIEIKIHDIHSTDSAKTNPCCVN